MGLNEVSRRRVQASSKPWEMSTIQRSGREEEPEGDWEGVGGEVGRGYRMGPLGQGKKVVRKEGRIDPGLLLSWKGEVPLDWQPEATGASDRI